MKVCGLDEVGRGALAGPLVAAGVIFGKSVVGLNDSKKLKREIRERVYEQITESGATVEIEIISARQINNRGIGWANKIAFKRLAKKMSADKFIADGNLKLGKKISSIVKADTKIPEVMAASIVAKVTRDRMMQELHKDFPGFGWDKNVGYGTKRHIEAIRTLGETKHHRSVFVRTALRKGEV
jgi:ribonuclease HII